jgi:hypothetical protein
LPFNIITSSEIIIIIINVPPNLSVTNEESTEATMNNRYDSLFYLLAETQAVVTLRLCSSVQIHCVCKQFSIHLFILCPIPISVSIQSKFILTVTTCFWNSNNTFKLMQELDKFMQDQESLRGSLLQWFSVTKYTISIVKWFQDVIH